MERYTKAMVDAVEESAGHGRGGRKGMRREGRDMTLAIHKGYYLHTYVASTEITRRTMSTFEGIM